MHLNGKFWTSLPDSKHNRLVDERDILRLLTGAQHRVQELHRPVLERETLESVADGLRRKVNPATDMIELMEISNYLKVIVRPGPAGSCGGEWTDGERYVLYSDRVAEPTRSFRRLHGLMHVVLKRTIDRHTEGDVNLCALRVALPPFLYSYYGWKELCSLCEIVPRRLILAWGVHLWSRRQLELPFSPSVDVDRVYSTYSRSDGTTVLTNKRNEAEFQRAMYDRVLDEVERDKPPSDLTKRVG